MRLPALTLLLASLVSAAVAQRPLPSSIEFAGWADRHVAQIVESVDQPRRTLYYVDARFGRDTNDGLHPRRAWKTLAQVRSALGSRVDDVEVSFRRGQTFRDPLGLSTVGVATKATFSAYGNGPRPHITTSTQVEARLTTRGGRMWQRTWTEFVPQVVSEAGDLANPYRRVTSLVACQTVEGSWFHGAGVLYVNVRRAWNGRTRTRLFFEVFPKSNVSGFEFLPGSSEVLVEGLSVSGYGADLDFAWDKYAVKGNLTGPNALVVRDCVLAYNGKHNAGNTSPSTGGVIVVVDSWMGWVTGRDTPFVHYAGQGGNEGYSVRNRFMGGQLPDPTGGDAAGFGLGRVNATYAHANTGKIGFHLVKDCVALPHLFQVNDFGGAGDANDFAADLSLCNNVLYGNRYLAHEPTAAEVQSVTLPAMFGQQPAAILQGDSTPGRLTAFFANNVWQVRPLWFRNVRGFGRGLIDRIQGLHVNSVFEVDLTFAKVGAPAGVDIGLVPYGESLPARFQNCHIYVSDPGPFNFGLVAQLLQDRSLGRETPDRFRMYDSIVTADSESGARLYLAAGNNRLADGTLASPSRIANLIHNLPGSSPAGPPSDWIGTGFVAGRILEQPWTAQRRPRLGELDVETTSLPGGARLEYDFSNMPRRVGTSAAGPFEALD